MNEDLRLCDCCLKAVVKGKYCPPCKQSRLSTIEEIENRVQAGFGLNAFQLRKYIQERLDQLKREK